MSDMPRPAGSADFSLDGDSMMTEQQEERKGFYSAISREMVRIYKDQFGRGPTKAKTSYAGPDCMICTLEESMTPAEKNMAALGEHQRLRDVRLFFQHASEDEFCEVIERLTGRKVRAFVSGMDTYKDVASEVFYFEQNGAGGP
jgi:uncharacterized protein YbcI